MKAVLYIRVSTEDQTIGLDAQLAKLKAWSELNDAEVVGEYRDAGISGTREDRPGLAAALDTACKHKAAIVVYSLSRLSRSTSHCIALADRLAKHDADLVSITEKIDTTTAAGRMVFRLLGSLAEFERDQIAERTASALQCKKARGERVGSVPFGYDLAADGIKLIPNAIQLEAVALINELRLSGLSYRDIADELTQRNITTAKGNTTWTHTAVARIVKRAA
jgi:DNA invertase Pin-like site-specific DNA recombinase